MAVIRSDVISDSTAAQNIILHQTYMKIGKRFLDEKSKCKELNGITTNEYLENTRAMFQDISFVGIWMNWIKSPRLPELPEKDFSFS